jgi:periplasmic protein TonB
MTTDLMATAQTEKSPVRQIPPRTQAARDGRIGPCASRSIPIATVRRNNLFSETLLEMSSTRPARPTGRLVLSMLFHALVLLALLLPPLYFTDTIDLKGFAQTFLVAPPPPPPPPPIAQAVAKVVPTARRLFASGKLLAPSVIPQKIAILKEEPLPPDIDAGVAGGTTGGVPGGQLGGVIGGIISGESRASVPVPRASQPKAPIRVGGRVKAPRLLSQPAPVYPVLAKQVGLQGDVSIDAVIDTQGDVVEMQVVSGTPLLIPAALEAVGKWKYEPTYLNEQAITVRLLVTVTFRLER